MALHVLPLRFPAQPRTPLERGSCLANFTVHSWTVKFARGHSHLVQHLDLYLFSSACNRPRFLPVVIELHMLLSKGVHEPTVLGAEFGSQRQMTSVMRSNFVTIRGHDWFGSHDR